MTTSKSSSTIRDVARLAGVSVATISRYLNHTAPLAADTEERVQRAMDELNFTPHSVARNLATHRTNNIGLVVENIGGDFFTPLLDGIVSVTQKNNLNLLIFTSTQSNLTQTNHLGPGNTDGLLVFVDALDPSALRELHHRGHPIVLIQQSAPLGLAIPSVSIENKAGARNLVDHLIEAHGRRRIVFLRGPEGNEDSDWREGGYRESLTQHGLAVEDELIANGDYDRFVAMEAVRKLIAQHVQFDAIFAADDESALGALQALKEAGLDVPGQVSLVGFDDQRITPFLTPPLTTVHAPTDRVGVIAAECILKLINKEPVDLVNLLPTEIVVRNSCGCTG
ncbi:MAG: LacI family DNA-binding transcriptional regulator [Anaerolineaceae bacterium]|nr:LacI family DNA-binding transcriptional regulator [Anaerolineaceae bacterium]